jgi:hypothetical protein
MNLVGDGEVDEGFMRCVVLDLGGDEGGATEQVTNCGAREAMMRGVLHNVVQHGSWPNNPCIFISAQMIPVSREPSMGP